MGRPKADIHLVRPARSNNVNLSDLAYDRLEDLIVTCALPPGMFLSLQALQERTGVGRTPIHQAVNRLAADTLILVRPRHGLQLAPIDLSRERNLLRLRRDMERFVVRLATERAGASQRNQLLHLSGTLRARGPHMAVAEFNTLDRQSDRLLVAAAGEAFLDATMRPLHTIFRRIGWIYHSRICPAAGLGQTVACHLRLLEAVASGQVGEAIAASDALIAFVDGMFDALGRGVDPALFDCNINMQVAG